MSNRLAINPDYDGYEAGHDWETVRVIREGHRREDQCRRCGLRVCVITMPRGNWVRSSDAQETPCRG